MDEVLTPQEGQEPQEPQEPTAPQANNVPPEETTEALKTDLEQEQAKIDEAVALATKDLNEQLASTTASLNAKDSEVKTLKAQSDQGAQQIATLRDARDAAVGKYRASLAAANPMIPEDLITGDSIEEIDASLESAKNLVSRIKEGLEAERESESVPAGAPPRTSPSTEGMTSRQKINYGLGQSRRS